MSIYPTLSYKVWLNAEERAHRGAKTAQNPRGQDFFAVMALMPAPLSSMSPTAEAKIPLNIMMARKHEAKTSDQQFPPGKHLCIGKRTTLRCHISKVGFDIAPSLALQLLDGFIPKLLLDVLPIGRTNPNRSTARAEFSWETDVAMKRESQVLTGLACTR